MIDLSSVCMLQVRDEVLELIPFKAKLFFVEVMSVLFTPVVLCFSLPHCAPAILEFIRDHTSYIDGVGAVCDYCTFDLDKYGDEDFACVPEPGHVEVGRRPANGKMEQSFLNFQQVHPDWQGGGQTGRSMVHRLRTYRTQRENERDMLMSAALQNSMSMHMMMPMGSQHQEMLSLSAAAAVAGQMPLPVGGPQQHTMGDSSMYRSQAGERGGVLLGDDMLPSGGPAPPTASAAPPTFPSRRLDPAQQQSHRPGCADPSYSDTDFFRSMGSVRRVGTGESGLAARGAAPSYANAPGSPFRGGGSTFLATSGHAGTGGVGHSFSSGGGMPSILRSILKRENIDYENDFYWLSKVSVLLCFSYICIACVTMTLFFLCAVPAGEAQGPCRLGAESAAG
jgi:hypothetical protein